MGSNTWVVQRVVVDDALIDAGDPHEIIDPVWWTGNIYDSVDEYEASLRQFTERQRLVFAAIWLADDGVQVTGTVTNAGPAIFNQFQIEVEAYKEDGEIIAECTYRESSGILILPTTSELGDLRLTRFIFGERSILQHWYRQTDGSISLSLLDESDSHFLQPELAAAGRARSRCASAGV